MAQTLHLGCCDADALPVNIDNFLSAFHEGPKLLGQHGFRGEATDLFRPFEPVPGRSVRRLQERLRGVGVLPHGEIDGIFGYRTRSAVRVFQEYVRAVEADASIGIPDGLVGTRTHRALNQWSGSNAEVAWALADGRRQSADHRRWMRLLASVRDAWIEKPSAETRAANAFGGPTDTRTLKAWNLDPNALHLVGVRRRAWLETQRRENDDLFILLVAGMSVVFAGSTDPNASMGRREDMPFIVPGQHCYRFGWHKLSSPKVYRALRCATVGPLVFRDRDLDQSLTESDMLEGAEVNPTVNIHWSGLGTSNWSAGCQVVSGRSYVDPMGRVVDCSGFASVNYAGLAGGKTRGAYDVMLDLLTIFAENIGLREGTPIHYTLLREADLASEPSLEDPAVTLERLESA